MSWNAGVRGELEVEVARLVEVAVDVFRTRGELAFYDRTEVRNPGFTVSPCKTLYTHTNLIIINLVVNI